MADVDKLKAEGDVLFAQKQFQKAYVKYSDAIALDGSNAIFYANRAACGLSMNQCLDAASDAKQAVKLDPGYSKAWARLGRAEYVLGGYNQSISAFKKAIALLPSKLTATERTSKKQYEEGIALAQETHENLLRQAEETNKRSARASEIRPDSDILPWNRANTLQSDTLSRDSSGWMIVTAYREFTEGVKIMQQTQAITLDSDGLTLARAIPFAVSAVVNGILQDPRVFHMDGGASKWIEMYDRHVVIELTMRKGWMDGGARKVKKEAVERLQVARWTEVRFALRVTVCGWIMSAFMSAYLKQHYVTAIELYRQALDVLQWGRQEWKDVPTNDRGSMFELTFIRAVKRLYLTTLIEAYDAHGKSNSQFNLEEAVDLANDIIADAKANPPSPDLTGPPNWGPLLSFWAYPVAEAHAVLGYYHMQTAQRPGIQAKDAQNHFAKSAMHYLRSAETFGKDDEKRPCFLSIAVKAYWHRGTALRLTLPLCERVREGLAKSAYIWGGYTDFHKTNDGLIDHCLQFQDHWKKQLDDGKVTLDYEAKPAWIT